MTNAYTDGRPLLELNLQAIKTNIVLPSEAEQPSGPHHYPLQRLFLVARTPDRQRMGPRNIEKPHRDGRLLSGFENGPSSQNEVIRQN